MTGRPVSEFEGEPGGDDGTAGRLLRQHAAVKDGR
jgi:hypothetical protein